jgi:tetratricopeptide (TPR) repeat protein
MSRLRFLPFLLIGVAAAQQQTPPPQQMPPDEDAKPPVQQKAGATGADSDLPPDEDAAANPKEQFSFNPVKSKKSVSAGEFYFKKGNYKAASERFREATQWNEGNADAWLKLGESEEKREQSKNARAAYEKYLQLAGNGKSAADVKKRLEHLK